jgi:hypothetical protein
LLLFTLLKICKKSSYLECFKQPAAVFNTARAGAEGSDTSPGGQRKDMKVVVTSQGEEMSSEVDPRFGLSNKFIVVDTESGGHQVISRRRGNGARGGEKAEGRRVQTGRQQQR